MEEKGYKQVKVLLLLALMMQTPVVAEDVVETNTMAIIKQGRTTPFDGFLLSPDVYAKMQIDKEFQKKELELNHQYQLAIQKNDFQLKLDVSSLKLESVEREMNARLQIKDQRILDLEKINAKLFEAAQSTTWDSVQNVAFFCAGMATVLLGAWAISAINEI